MLYQKKSVFTFKKFYGNLNTRKNAEVIQILHGKLFDLESIMDDIYDRPDLKIVNANHVLQVKKESAHIDYSQEFHGEADSEHNYKKNNAYRNVQRKRRIRNIFKYLKQLEKPKLRA